MRRWLVIFLALSAAILSFDALRAYAIDGQPTTNGVIPQTTVAPRGWLAMLWALVIDGMAAAGILGVRDDRRDWRAWAMFVLAIGASLGFQVFALPPIVARAVPPIALALAIIVLELPRARSHTVMARSGGPTAAVDTGGADAPSPTTPPVPVPVPVPTRGLSKADKQALYRARTQAAKKGEDVAAALEQVISVRNIDRSVVAEQPKRQPLPSENGQHERTGA